MEFLGCLLLIAIAIVVVTLFYIFKLGLVPWLVMAYITHLIYKWSRPKAPTVDRTPTTNSWKYDTLNFRMKLEDRSRRTQMIINDMEKKLAELDEKEKNKRQ